MPQANKSTGSGKTSSGRLLMFSVLGAAVVGGILLGSFSSGDPVAADPMPVEPVARVAAAPAAVPAGATIARVRLDLEGAPSLGPADAPVTVVEFVDYQCPFCRRAHSTVKQLVERYGDKVRLVFLQSPLDFHKDAPLASQAALAAGEQGRFIEMHDLLLGNAKLQLPDLLTHARSLGLDMDAFQAALTSGRHARQVEEGRAQAQRAGASATPFFFINGRPLRGAQPIQAFETIINEELAGNLPPTRWLAKVEAPPQQQRPQRPAEDPNKIYVIDVANSISQGPDDATVTLVEFTDYQCPFCSRSQTTLQKIREQYPEQVRIVVKNLPLSFHSQAEPAAIASLAADRQGKYWDYRPILFANQRTLTPENLRAYAQQAGLDLKKFDADVMDPELKAIVQRDLKQASAVGVTGTPTFFINGKKMVGAQPFETFKGIIDQHLGAGGSAGS